MIDTVNYTYTRPSKYHHVAFTNIYNVIADINTVNRLKLRLAHKLYGTQTLCAVASVHQRYVRRIYTINLE